MRDIFGGREPCFYKVVEVGGDCLRGGEGDIGGGVVRGGGEALRGSGAGVDNGQELKTYEFVCYIINVLGQKKLGKFYFSKVFYW